MADDASGNENPFFFLSEHIENRGFGYDSAILGSCGYDFAILEPFCGGHGYGSRGFQFANSTLIRCKFKL